MKNSAKALIAVGIISMMPTIANARGLTAGEYSLSGIQQICLKTDGTWYSTTFSAWGGHWQIQQLGTVKTTYIYGNYSGGAGNDSFVVLGASNSKWTEWRDDLSFENVIQNLSVTKLSSFCGPPAAPTRKARGANPSN